MTTTKEILITPDLAKKYLSMSEGNRPLQKARIEGYVRDLQNGRWYLGDTIKFDENGILIDGHHRLNAIVWSGIDTLTLVTHGLPVQSRNGINLAKPWTPSEISTITGEAFGKRHFSISRMLEFGLNGILGRDGRYFLTYTENRDLVLKYEVALNFIVKYAGHQRYVNNPVLAVIARAYYYPVDRERLIQFINVLRDGLPESKDDVAALLLRNWMIVGENRGHNPSRPEVYKKAERALSHFLKRKQIRALYPATEELFPLKLNSSGAVVPE